MTVSSTEYIDSDFLHDSEETVTVVSGGTYPVLFSAIVSNEDMETFTAMVQLPADISTGEKEILGTSGWKSLTTGSVGNVVVGQIVYLPPGATVMAEEVTISSFTGVPDFGRFYQFVHDDEIVQTTSTLFSLRLAVSTGTLASGMYRAGLSFDWDMSNAGVKFESQLLLDGSKVFDQYSDLPVITGTYQKDEIAPVENIGVHCESKRESLDNVDAKIHRKVRLEGVQSKEEDSLSLLKALHEGRVTRDAL
ncbi:hypothetical protein BDK51DRAFT_25795 [Blyttiomyces helicus]|uniref:Uncharacterized protein n=1 Tax=Blyttiomyces helicus TaxID=388810 RepID=A0A4P9W809_9FUNG|nr:hypothetical protein BDK51DRAFT_25795 [Blyttiomyces helicus]|eukprot:RKO88639.1 hypothetical protein BDK51DRAFT_25795 [Blyttiomyces helicus]